MGTGTSSSSAITRSIRRILVNELVASALLGYLKYRRPGDRPRPCEPGLSGRQSGSPSDAWFSSASKIEPGWHFGSRYPGDPGRVAVYDFLPDALLTQVANREDFRAILVFDKWVGNADGRQCVFYRAMVQDERAGSARPGFVARMIDHGFAFNGPHWDFPESPLQGLYARRLVYEGVRSLDDFQPWLDQVVHFPEEAIDRAWKQIPGTGSPGKRTPWSNFWSACLNAAAGFPT